MKPSSATSTPSTTAASASAGSTSLRATSSTTAASASAGTTSLRATSSTTAASASAGTTSLPATPSTTAASASTETTSLPATPLPAISTKSQATVIDGNQAIVDGSSSLFLHKQYIIELATKLLDEQVVNSDIFDPILVQNALNTLNEEYKRIYIRDSSVYVAQSQHRLVKPLDDKSSLFIGEGLFAKERIQVNDIISEYRGEFINNTTKTERVNAGKGGYIIRVNNDRFLDCYDNAKRYLCLASKSNSAYKLVNIKTEHQAVSNAQIKIQFPNNKNRQNPVYVLQATCEINQDEEILCEYEVEGLNHIESSDEEDTSIACSSESNDE